MDNEYGYANARLRAMKSRLLTRSAYMELANEPSVEDVIADLTRTPYQAPLEAALVKSSGWACLSEGLRVYFAQTITRISNFFSGMPKQLWRILVSRWEVFNIKTILRGQANNVPADEILDALIPTGELQEPDFKRLVQQTSVRATVDLLSTWNNPHARALRAAMPRYAETGNLAELEVALDRAHYKLTFKELSEMEDANADQVREVLEDEVDATNLLTVVRLAEAGVANSKLTKQYGSAAPEPLLIRPGGHVTLQLQAYKEVPTLEQLVRDMRETRFGDALARGQARYKEKKSLAAFEDEIEGQLARQQIGLFNRDPLSIGIAIAYLAALVDEVRNLRLIGRGKTVGWKREEIEKELRLWQS
jgi:V/A-type H+-transporting ATPase subunit C